MDLKKYFSKFTFNYVLYMVSSFMPPLSGFILLPIYSNYFTKEEYGTLNLILLVSTIFSTIFYFGVNSTFARLYHDKDNSADKKSFYSTSLFLILTGFFIQLIIGYFFSQYFYFLIFDNNLYKELLFISIIGQGICFVTHCT